MGCYVIVYYRVGGGCSAGCAWARELLLLPLLVLSLLSQLLVLLLLSLVLLLSSLLLVSVLSFNVTVLGGLRLGPRANTAASLPTCAAVILIVLLTIPEMPIESLDGSEIGT